MRLRFVERFVPHYPGGQYGSMVKVLQYETLEPWDDPEMAKLGGGQFKWRDVPTERDDAAPSPQEKKDG
jgi:hypothetical protein